MENKILSTIQNFKASDPKSFEEKYTCGDCYVFAQALAKKFNGQVYYLAIDNHFIAKISDIFYDIRGQISEEEIYECYLWEEYIDIEPLDAARVEYYCIQGKKPIKL